SRGYFTDDPDAQNYIFLDMGRTISFEEARKIGKLEPIKNEGVALISTSAGVSLLNTGGFDSNPEFARWVQDEVTPLLSTPGRMFRAASDGDLISNDWTQNPNGEVYRRRAATEGSSLIPGATDLLIERVARINRRFGDRYGWNQAPGDLGARGGPGEVRGGGPADTGDGGDVRGDKAAERL